LYIALTLLLGFAAVNTGNNLLYLVVSALLGFMAISGVMGKGNLDRLAVSLEFPDEIYAGHATLARVRLANGRRRFPAFLIEVSLAGERVTFPLVLPGSSAVRSCPARFERRGSQPLAELTIRSIFPINFFSRYLRRTPPQTVTVFPAPVTCRGAVHGDGRQQALDGETSGRGLEGDIERIGDYRGSEPIRLIHWKLSARHDQLKVKELSRPQSVPLWLEPDKLPGGTLERRLGCASFLVNRACREGQPVGLRIGTRRVGPGSGRGNKLRLLHELADYGRH